MQGTAAGLVKCISGTGAPNAGERKTQHINGPQRGFRHCQAFLYLWLDYQFLSKLRRVDTRIYECILRGYPGVHSPIELARPKP